MAKNIISFYGFSELNHSKDPAKSIVLLTTEECATYPTRKHYYLDQVLFIAARVVGDGIYADAMEHVKEYGGYDNGLYPVT